MNAVSGAIDGAAGGGEGGGTPPAGSTPAPAPAAGVAPQGGDGSEAGVRWQDALPEALRADETLATYRTPEDAHKALIETKRWARGRIALPNAEDPASFDEFAGKVRPAKPEDYKIATSEGEASPIGEAFRSTFFDIGLHPIQAEKLTAAWNQYNADATSRMQQEATDELTAIEVELGAPAYTQRLTAVSNMLRNAGVEVEDVASAMQQVAGAGKAMRALFTLAEKTGELGKVDGATVRLNMGAMNKAEAQAELDRMNGDAATRQAVMKNPTGPEAQKRKLLMDRVKQRD